MADRNHNPTGKNQHGQGSILKRHPDVLDLIQEYLFKHTYQKHIPEYLERNHNIKIGLRTVERLIKDHNLRTTRHSGMTETEKGAAILDIIDADDPLNRFGCRKIRDKLGHKGVLVSRDFIEKFRRIQDPEGAYARHPSQKKVHTAGLWAAGPNEEWNVDGHEKILPSMGIAVWGGCDKYSRMELGLWAVPDARQAEVPPACFLLMAKKYGGVPLQLVSDKGSETGILAALQYSLRTTFMPDLSPDEIPPHRFVQSKSNITRERGWRPLWEQELANIKNTWEEGKVEAGFREFDELHVGVARWLWAKVVQKRLDDFVHENHWHYVPKQKKRLLPSGARHMDLYTFPDRYGGRNCLIRVPAEAVDRLIAQHVDPKLFQFGSDELVSLCEDLYGSVGAPDLAARNAWAVFHAMLTVLATRPSTI